MKLLYNPYDLLVKPDFAHACADCIIFLKYLITKLFNKMYFIEAMEGMTQFANICYLQQESLLLGMEYMSTEQKYSYVSKSLDQSLALGVKLAYIIKPPMLIELVGDLGGGKTALVKAIAKGLGIEQTVTSPTFNIHRGYEAPNGIHLEHFDLYRLNDDEIVANELKDSLEDPKTIVCTEWANHFSVHMAEDRLTVECHYINENERRYDFVSSGPESAKIIKELQK